MDIWRCTHENDETDFFKEVEMAHMEEVESSSNINNLLSRLRALAVRKLVGISTISTYNSHADCTKMVIFANQQDGHLKKFLSSWQEL